MPLADANGNSHTNSNSYGYCHRDSDGNADAYSDAAGNADAKAASDAATAPDSLAANCNLKAGTREKNSRVLRLGWIDFSEGDAGSVAGGANISGSKAALPTRSTFARAFQAVQRRKAAVSSVIKTKPAGKRLTALRRFVKRVVPASVQGDNKTNSLAIL